MTAIPNKTKFEVSNTDIFKELYFENKITFYTINVQMLNTRFYPMLKKNIGNILEEIEASLKI